MVAVALLSNPKSTGNKDLLPRIRDWCAEQPDVLHAQVETTDQIGKAMAQIAAVNPRVLIINGGDGTVQAALTELHFGNHFGDNPPPVAVLPNGKTNLIALDLGAAGDPMKALERIVSLSRTGLDDHVVQRELIALTEGEQAGVRPVIGMFLGGAGFADIILYCRHQIYPLGLPNALSHVIAGLAVFIALFSGLRWKYLPPKPAPVKVSLSREGQVAGNFTFLVVTTLEKLVFGAQMEAGKRGLKLMAVEDSGGSLFRAFFASLRGTLGKDPVEGLHLKSGDMIRIESDRSSVILDGEEYQARTGRPIILRSTPPMNFLRIAA